MGGGGGGQSTSQSTTTTSTSYMSDSQNRTISEVANLSNVGNLSLNLGSSSGPSDSLSGGNLIMIFGLAMAGLVSVLIFARR
jgi:hypothetical protein